VTVAERMRRDGWRRNDVGRGFNVAFDGSRATCDAMKLVVWEKFVCGVRCTVIEKPNVSGHGLRWKTQKVKAAARKLARRRRTQ